MKQSLQVIAAHRFGERDFVGGDAALDFINTVAGRDVAGRDRLDCYARLLDWAEGAGLLPEKTLRSLRSLAESDPAAAARALARAKALRESLFSLVAAIAAGEAPSKDALAALRDHWIAGVKAHELRVRGGQIVAGLAPDAASLDLVAALAAWRLVEFVLKAPAERLRICQGPDCAWLFIDRSKAGRRRWCDMAVCGNAAKSRRFLARSRRGRRVGG